MEKQQNAGGITTGDDRPFPRHATGIDRGEFNVVGHRPDRTNIVKALTSLCPPDWPRFQTQRCTDHVDPVLTHRLNLSRLIAAFASMSAVTLKEDMNQARRQVRFGPKPNSCAATRDILFDHLVGGDKQASRRSQTESFGRLEIEAVSYFVGVCTGRSAALAPRRIRST